MLRKLNSAPPPSGRIPTTVAHRIDAAFGAGWIDSELRDDLHKLRQLRNEFAHSIDVSSLSDESLQETIRSLQVPRREYYDWDQLGAVARPDGSVVIHAGRRPDDAVEDLRVGGLLFKIGLSVIFCVLLASLRLEFAAGDMDELLVATVPSRLMIPSSDATPD